MTRIEGLEFASCQKILAALGENPGGIGLDDLIGRVNPAGSGRKGTADLRKSLLVVLARAPYMLRKIDGKDYVLPMQPLTLAPAVAAVPTAVPQAAGPATVTRSLMHSTAVESSTASESPAGPDSFDAAGLIRIILDTLRLAGQPVAKADLMASVKEAAKGQGMTLSEIGFKVAFGGSILALRRAGRIKLTTAAGVVSYSLPS